jgi:hypothetical protein
MSAEGPRGLLRQSKPSAKTCPLSRVLAGHASDECRKPSLVVLDRLTDCDQTYTIGRWRCHVAVADTADRSLYRRGRGGGDSVLDSIVPRQPYIEIGSHVDRAGAGSGPPDYSAIWRARHLADASPDRFTGDSLGAYPEPLMF